MEPRRFGFHVEAGGVARVDAPRADEVLGVRPAGHGFERALVEFERFARAQDLGHEAQPLGAVEAGRVAFVDGAHLRGQARAQCVQCADGGLPVGLPDGDGQRLDRRGVAAG
nr:hypothetical protein [Bifidobacterium pseudocatenulatum]